MKVPVLLLAISALCASYSNASTSTSSMSSINLPRPGDSTPSVTGTDNTPSFPVEQLYALTVGFHNAFIYPNNLAEANKVNSSLFSSDCQGNIDITRNFVGAELNTEYVFGSFANVGKTNSLNLLGVPLSWNMTHWTGYQSTVSFAVTFQMHIPQLNVTLPLEIWTWLTFNKAGQINQYDATFRYTEYYLETILTLGAPALKASTPQQAVENLTKSLASNICTTAQNLCTGANKVYATYDSCFTFLTSGIIPLGQPYQAGRNTIICRMIHEPMVSFRPEVHCPHIGPLGGGMCVDDFTYVEKVQDPWTFFANAPWLPQFPFAASEIPTTGGPLSSDVQ